MIAEQNVEPGNLVEWISADPVTGSSVRILKNGMFFDQERKELEPLGQEILPIEPPAQSPPPSLENVRFSAQESEWQCQAAEARFGKEDFFSKPVHCQKAALAANDAGFNDLHPYKEETIVTIEFGKSKLPSMGLWNSAADRTMSYSLRSSAKKTGDDDDDKEDDEIIPKYENVEVNDDIFDSIDAQDKKRKIEHIKIPKDFKRRVLERAGPETECGEKILQLIDTLESNTGKDKFEQKKKDIKKNISYIESLFNRVGKIGQNNDASPFTADTGSNDYYAGGAKISMGLAPSDIIGKDGYSHIKSLDDVYDRYVSVFLHDLVHTASKNGRYTDQELLEAVIDVMKSDGKKAPEFSGNTRIASARINDFFGAYCPLSKR